MGKIAIIRPKEDANDVTRACSADKSSMTRKGNMNTVD